MRTDLLKVLRKTRLSSLSEMKLRTLVIGGQPLPLRAGDCAYEEGDAARVGVVVSGLLRTQMKTSSGRQVTVCYAKRFEIVGATLLFAGPAPACMQAMTDGLIFLLDVERVTELSRRDAEIARALGELVARRLYGVLEELAGNTFASVRQRVAKHLLALAVPSTERRFPLVAPVSQQDLADNTGSVREVVARALRDFRQAGLISTAPEAIEILDPARLAEQTWSR